MKPPSITSFEPPFSFLSNFYPALVQFEGKIYPTVEHAYQAAKTYSHSYRASIQTAQTAGEAKKRGREAPMWRDWPERKLRVMENLLWQKFLKPDLMVMLKTTGDRELIEGNYWNDTYWGQCPVGIGDNHLGRLLMKIRKELRTTERKDK